MHINDIAQDIARRDLRAIEGAFRALAGFPGEDNVEGATGPGLVKGLDLVVEALAHDTSIMPSGTCDQVGLPVGSTYADGVASVRGNRDWWVRHLNTVGGR